MIELFGIHINESIKMDNIHYLLRFVSHTRAKRVMSFYNFSIDVNGKPELEFPAGVFFNISHSGDWVVCAISNNIVGIDVECMKKPELKIAKRFFTAIEYEFIFFIVMRKRNILMRRCGIL